jgi:2-phosphosulfolactate phosphatase
MDVEVLLTHSNIEESALPGRTVVVIDVLRASSTIATALHHGARAVMPVLDMAQAGKIAANLAPNVYRLGGERAGKKIEGYHLGNSPLEYTEEVVKGRDIILNTTNGTRALSRSRGAEHLVSGCFLNAGRVVDFIRDAGCDVTIVCAGRQHRVSLEDTLCAGLILDRLWGEDGPSLVSDAAHAARTLYRHDRDDLPTTLRRCNHAQYLIELGHEEDVDYCTRTDALPVLPYYTDNRLVLYDSLNPKPLGSKNLSQSSA